MKKLFLLFILFVSSFAVHAAECNAQKDPMLEILSNELMRNFKTLKKQKPPVYYLSYQLRVMKELNLIAVAGDLSQNTKGSFGWLDVDSRVGSAQTDNTHELKGFWNKYRLEGGVVPTDQKSRRALRHLLWRSTQKAVEQAQDDYNNVVSNKQVSSASLDPSDDFVLPQKQLFCQTHPEVTYDRPEIANRLKEISALVKEYDFIDKSAFAFSLSQEDTFFVNSVGSRLRIPRILGRYSFMIQAQTPEGMIL